MTRLVFRVLVGKADDDSPAFELALEEPPLLGRRPEVFTCTGLEPEFMAIADAAPAAGAIKAAGRKLYDAVAANTHLSQFLTTALQVQRPERYPVFVEFTTPGAETLPWEMLCAPSGDFLGLDERWAVGRLIDTLSTLQPVWQITPPLRIAAVLSCLGVPAAEEWRALETACTSLAGLPVELLLLVSEVELHEQITAAATPGVQVHFVPDDVAGLQQLISGFRPHVLHLFCHGSSTQTKPHLQIAVKKDWLGTGASSLLVEAREVRDFTTRTDSLPWLVVLNCCESASAIGPENVQSVALNLVYEGGVPAVVGMREPVRSDDATLFTQAFYDPLLRELASRVAGAERTGEPVDWPLLVVQARARLARKRGLLSEAAESTKEWTMPVVYTRPTAASPPAPPPPPPPPPFAAPPAVPPPPPVAPAPDAPGDAGESTRAQRLEIEALTGLLGRMAADADPGLVAEVEHRIAELRGRLGAS